MCCYQHMESIISKTFILIVHNKYKGNATMIATVYNHSNNLIMTTVPLPHVWKMSHYIFRVLDTMERKKMCQSTMTLGTGRIQLFINEMMYDV